MKFCPWRHGQVSDGTGGVDVIDNDNCQTVDETL
jgi:hypothetical protein